MKKTIMLSLILASFISCNEKTTITSQHKMNCEIVVGNISRCENQDAVCYGTSISSENPEYLDEAPSCIAKKAQ